MNKISVSARIVSALIDYVPVVILSLIFYIPILIIVFSGFRDMLPEIDNQEIYMKNQMDILRSIMPYACILLVVSSLYYLCKDLFGGQSIGKRIKKLQIVRKSKNIPVSNARLILRNLFIIIYLIEFIMYFVDPSQRLGDMACDTMVVPADERNRQAVDKKKITFSILIVFVCLSIFSFLYYLAVDLYLQFIENVMVTLPHQ